MAAADETSIEKLFADCYPELRRLAHSRLTSGGRNSVLSTTALVHESFLRLCGLDEKSFPDQARFFVYAGKVMRSVIVDLVRQRQSERHGGAVQFVEITTQIEDRAHLGEAQILRVNEALEKLSKLDARMAQVVELRYFAGMTEAETAKALGITDRTVRRDWQQARLLLAEALSSDQ
jgi:RNA polymerase sigma factor (TIGR02999 family)